MAPEPNHTPTVTTVCPRCMGQTFIVRLENYETVKPEWWSPWRYGVYTPIEGVAIIGFCIDTRCAHSEVEFRDDPRSGRGDGPRVAEQQAHDSVGATVRRWAERLVGGSRRLVGF